MWGSKPLVTVSTADISVLHSAKVVHFHHNSRKSSEELCTQPRCVDQAQYHTSEVWLHRDATRPLQRFPNLHWSAKVSGRVVITLPNEEDALTKTYIYTSRGPSYTPSTHSPLTLLVRPLQTRVSNYSAKTRAMWSLWLYYFPGWFSMFQLNHMIL